MADSHPGDRESFPMADSDQIEISVDRGVTVVRLGADFDSLYESELVKLQSVRDLAETVAPAFMLIDLSNTKYFGSAFIGFLIAIANRLKERGDGRLGLCGLAPFARMALEKTKSDTILVLFDTSEEGVVEFAASAE